jgi:hypothetical protein
MNFAQQLAHAATQQGPAAAGPVDPVEAQFEQFQGQMATLQEQNLQKAEEARAAAIAKEDKEQARYPVVETPEQEAEQRAILVGKGLSPEKVDKRIAKFKKRGGQRKTSAKWRKAGRIITDTLTGLNDGGAAPITEAREARLNQAGEDAFNEVMRGGEKMQAVLAQKAQFALGETVRQQQQEQAVEYEKWEKVAQGAQKYGIPVQDEEGQPVPKEYLEAQVAEAESYEKQAKQLEQEQKAEMQRQAQHLQRVESLRSTAQVAIQSGNAAAFDYEGGHEDLMSIGLSPEGFQQMVQGSAPTEKPKQGQSQAPEAKPPTQAAAAPAEKQDSPAIAHAKRRTQERTLAKASMDVEDAFQDLEDLQKGYLHASDLLAPHALVRNIRRRLIRGNIDQEQIVALLEGEEFAQALESYSQAYEALTNPQE